MAEPSSPLPGERDFRAPFDMPAQQATVIYIIAVIGLVLVLWGALPDWSPPAIALNIAFLAAVAVPYLLHIRGYEIGESALKAGLLLGGPSLPLREITGLGLLSEEDERALHPKGLIRFGIFGYRGRLRLGEGNARIAANRLTGLVRIETQNGDWLLGPEDPEGFLRLLESVIAGLNPAGAAPEDVQ